MKKAKILAVTFAATVLFAVSQPAAAHNLWLNPDNHYPKVGDTVEIGIGWGHKYPASRVDQAVNEGTVQHITALDPDGKTASLKKVSETLYNLKIEKKGVYIVVANTKPGVFTTTTEGRKWADRKGVENPIKCTSYEIMASSVIVAGGGDKGLSGKTGMSLEFIPGASPAGLKKGDSFKAQVLFKGKPLADAEISATYAGFTDEAVDDHAGKMHRHAIETKTDDKGVAEIVISKNGYWMISASHRSPYPDRETCDEYMYNSAFTFEVK